MNFHLTRQNRGKATREFNTYKTELILLRFGMGSNPYRNGQ